MKTSNFLIWCIAILPFTAFAQTTGIVKGYAYSRETLPGVVRAPIPREDGTTETPIYKAIVQHMVYIESKSSPFLIRYIWINGKKYKASVMPVTTLPLVINNQTVNLALPGDTLVRKTTNKVWEVILEQPVKAITKMPAAFTKVSKQNSIVIEYSYKNKTCFYGIAGVKKLHSVALQ